ncbi:MAG: class I SAM-dependent methyltransferase [Deltaproteobacteria bacterium]|jgi:SAM-dependent methyltransferase|nr:class I SAM-dependent methyltransferase [Deltaproteobacteria bacterium]
MKRDNDYGRFFIVDGRHVGDYEAMYQNCPDPWWIEKLGLRLDMRAALLLLDLCPKPLTKILDAGAGTGLFSLEIARVIEKNSPGCQIILSDISPTALSNAQKRLTEAKLNINFEYISFDLRQIDSPKCPWPDGTFQVIILAQVLWGLLENITGLFNALAAKLVKGGYLLMSQHFLKPMEQKYGADIINSPAQVENLASSAGLTLVHTLETDRGFNHHWAALWISN